MCIRDRRSSINQRLRGTFSFYKWAFREKLIQFLPFSNEEISVKKSPGFFAHLEFNHGRYLANELTMQTYSPIPKFLAIQKSIQFCDQLTPRRLRLMGYLMLLTGMRREETAELRYIVVPNPAGHDSKKQLPMQIGGKLSPTKGGKERVVMLPYDLAVALNDYFIFERSKLAKKFKRKYGYESEKFFLSSTGEEISSDGITSAFKKLSDRCGIKCHPHMLRHTFGTYELLRMSRNRDQSLALLWVKERMGHSSMQTTEKYIHATDLIEHDAVDGYQFDICEALRNGN